MRRRGGGGRQREKMKNKATCVFVSRPATSYREKGRERGRETDRQTDRQRQRQRHRERGGDTERASKPNEFCICLYRPLANYREGAGREKDRESVRETHREERGRDTKRKTDRQTDRQRIVLHKD